MEYGFVKVAAATPVTAVADCHRNAQSIIELTAELTRMDAELILFPELCLTSCSCGDLFTQPHFIQACDKAIASIADATAENGAIIVFGAPVEHRNALYNCAIVMHKGEIIGFAGLVGAGRTEIMRAIFGVDYIKSLDVYVKGKKVKITDPASAKRQKIAFLTEDRKVEGLTLDFTIKSNMVAANLPSIRKGLFTSKKLENAIADEYIEKIRVKTPSRNQKVGNLSGGNQQKVVVGKWLNSEPDILIMDEPTRGIDVGAKREIYEIINDLVAQGKSVILISSELPEVLGMSDRVLVMKDDAIVAELTGEDINPVEVMKYAL